MVRSSQKCLSRNSATLVLAGYRLATKRHHLCVDFCGDLRADFCGDLVLAIARDHLRLERDDEKSLPFLARRRCGSSSPD
ncbi:MAG: hypothetical protein IT495_11840 [Gammaproteobacteria bacterium]|nr:hypothetical protein [Gammaproteobacteria bacterium]